MYIVFASSLLSTFFCGVTTYLWLCSIFLIHHVLVGGGTCTVHERESTRQDKSIAHKCILAKKRHPTVAHLQAFLAKKTIYMDRQLENEMSNDKITQKLYQFRWSYTILSGENVSLKTEFVHIGKDWACDHTHKLYRKNKNRKRYRSGYALLQRHQ